MGLNERRKGKELQDAVLPGRVKEVHPVPTWWTAQ